MPLPSHRDRVPGIAQTYAAASLPVGAPREGLADTAKTERAPGPRAGRHARSVFGPFPRPARSGLRQETGPVNTSLLVSRTGGPQGHLDGCQMTTAGCRTGPLPSAYGHAKRSITLRPTALPVSVRQSDQRRPAKRSFSGTTVPAAPWTRTKVSTPINSPNRSLPILRKKMFSP